MSRTPWRASALVALALVGCGGGRDESPMPSAPDEITLASVEFGDGEIIPTVYTCDGDDIWPPLDWAGVPDETREFALIMEDPDAGGFVHWVLFKIPPDREGFEAAELPPGARQGSNSQGEAEYAGPCPPEEENAHRYEFVLYALSQPIDLTEGATANEVREAISGITIGSGKLSGRFDR